MFLEGLLGTVHGSVIFFILGLGLLYLINWLASNPAPKQITGIFAITGAMMITASINRWYAPLADTEINISPYGWRVITVLTLFSVGLIALRAHTPTDKKHDLS